MIGAVVFTVVGMVVICTGIVVLVRRGERAHVRRMADTRRATADALTAWARETGDPEWQRRATNAEFRARLYEKRLGRADR